MSKEKEKKEYRDPFLKELPPITEEERQLANYFIMKKMRERFGEKPYNSEEQFPDPRVKRLKKNPPRRLKMTLEEKMVGDD